MKISKNDIYSRLFGFNPSTLYRWRENEEERPILGLIDNVFTLSELKEWVEDKIIPARFQVLKEQQLNLQYAKRQYFDILDNTIGSLGDIVNKDFMDFYFNVLVYSKYNIDRQTKFSPYDIKKSSLLFMAEADSHIIKEDTKRDYFSAGIEALNLFDCLVNQFLFTNIMQDFQPMIKIEIDYGEFKLNAKVESYLHAILFALYDTHQDKSIEEKRVILFTLLNEFYSFFKLPTIDERNFKNTSFDAMLNMNFDVVQKHFDKLIEAIQQVQG